MDVVEISEFDFFILRNTSAVENTIHNLATATQDIKFLRRPIDFPCKRWFMKNLGRILSLRWLS